MIWLEKIHFFFAALRFFLLSKVIQPILFVLFRPFCCDFSINSIQSHDILADINRFSGFNHDKRSFLLKFVNYKNVTYIEREDVSLYSVSEKEFIFVRARPGVDLFNTEEHPFHYDIQHDSAVELLTVSHDTIFQYLKRKPVIDGRNISYLHNSGRCGSTLVAAMIFKTKQCVVQSEPSSIVNLAWMLNEKKYPPSRKSVEYLDLVRAVFQLICPDPEKLYFIKPWGIHTLSLLPLIHQALPGITELFMYRSLRPTILSYAKIFKDDLIISGNKGVSLLPVNYSNIWNKIKCGDGKEAFLFIVLCQIHAYMLETSDRNDIKSYSYESLLENKEEFTRSLLREVGIGEEYFQDALSALERDSHANAAYVSQKSLAKVKNVTISVEIMEWVKTIAMDEFGIKVEGEEGRFTNLN